MSVSSMAHRRKVTTYGKASRKLTVATAEAFTKATLADAWELERNSSDWERDMAPILEDTASTSKCYTGLGPSMESTMTNSSTSCELQKNESAKPAKHKMISASSASQSTKTNHVLDILPLEDDYQQRSSPSPAESVKRRKISPEYVIEDCSIVFDDVTLQRHIAAQSQSDFGSDLPFSGNGSTVWDTQEKESHIPDRDGPGLPKERMTRKQKVLGSGAITRDKASNRVKAQSRVQSHSPKSTMLSWKAQKAAGTASSDITQASIADEMYATASSNSDGNKESFQAHIYLQPPKTPPRPIKHMEGVPTPRQRELWNRLLDGKARSGSPSTLDLPRLSLTDKKDNTVMSHIMDLQHTTEITRGDASGSRRKRIVDTLHRCDHDLSHKDDYVAEDSESSCTGDISDSMRTRSSAINGAIILETSPSADSQTGIGMSKGRTLSDVHQPVPSLHAAVSKVTYARHRSYLTGNDSDEVAMLEVPVAPASVKRRGSGRGGNRGQEQKFNSIFDFEHQGWDGQDSQGGVMRSIHELREAGGNVRLVSELEAILDDVDEDQPSSSTVQGTRLLDLIVKLQEPSSCRLFTDQGLESRLLAHVGVSTDLITNSLLAMAILQLIAGPTTTPLLSQVSDHRIVGFLIDLLGFDQSLASQAKLRGHNLSKYARQEYSNLCKSVSKSNVWRAGRPPVLSCRVLALQCLEYIVRQTRESGSLSDVLSAYAIRRIVATSIPPFSTPLPQCTPQSAIQLELAVSILESCTISSAAEFQHSLWEGPTLERLTGLLPLLHSWDENECGMSRSLTLRLYVNLTNNNPGLCEYISTPAIVEVICKDIIAHFEQLSNHAISRQQPKLLDNLILSLGVLVNLAESSDRVSRLVTMLHWEDRSYLAVLLDLFTTNSKSAAEVRTMSSSRQ